MSAIEFNFPDGESLPIFGGERHWMAHVINEFAMPFFGIRLFGDDQPILKAIPEDHYLHRLPAGRSFQESFHTYIVASGADHFMLPDGTKASIFSVLLNTAVVVGSPVIEFMCRLHGQSELHCWFEDEAVGMVADTIERGRRLGVYRDSAGWEALVDKLRTKPTEVVCSYTVCESFPDAYLSGRDVDEEEGPGDEWYDLPFETQWAECMVTLRQSEDHLQIESLDGAFRFRDGVTAMDVRKAIETDVANAI